MIVSMIYNTHCGKQPAKSPSDYMPDFNPPQSIGDQVVTAFKAIKARNEKE